MQSRTRLVTNLLNTDHKRIQLLTVNLVAAKTRVDTLEGRGYTVVPMVLLTEGVHAGSSGPLLYNSDELGKTPAVWNHKPVVLYHPELNGEGISACDPAILNNRKIGIMFNTKYEKGRLLSEAWVDMDRCKTVDERVFNAINNGEMMELSTGLFCDLDSEPGEFTRNDAAKTKEKYVGIARNFRPDHLAVLPDKVGACSIADGAGFLRNERKDPAWAGLRILANKMGLGRLLENEMSFSNIEGALCALLQKRLNTSQTGPWPYVADVYDNFFIYEYDGKLFRLAYTTADDGVSLGEDAPVEVRRVSEYRTVGGAYVGNHTSDQPQENTNMNKTAMIAAILANTASGWSEADRPVLTAMADLQVSNIHKGMLALNAAANPPPQVDPRVAVVSAIIGNAALGWTEADRTLLMTMNDGQLARINKPAPAPAPAAAPAPTVTANVNPQLSEEAFIAMAPAQIREVLTNGVQLAREERARLTGVILGNARNQFSKEYLEHPSRSLGELRALAALAQPVQPAGGDFGQYNYGGQGMAPTTNSEPEACLEMPSTMPAAPAAK